MKPTIDDHAARFNELASEYDDLARPVYAACRALVIEEAAPQPSDVVLDLGTGTGAIAIRLASDAGHVIGRDISEAMLSQARQKATDAGITNVDFDLGRFRAPDYEGSVDVVTSNYALHHLDDLEKREAIGVVAGYQPTRFVLGDVMFFGDTALDEPAFDPQVDDPATVGMLASALTDVGFVITRVLPVTEQAGVIVAEAPAAGWEHP